MKSILQNIALISSILLIVSCSGGGGNSENPGVVIPDPQNGINGQAVKGVISGATITVTDANGTELGVTGTVTTGADGSYSLVFTPAQVTAGIEGPLVVTIDGTGATTVCDFDVPNTDDDCPVGDGTFAAFGATYNLPDGFTLRGQIADVPEDSDVADPVVTVNVSPASDVAYQLAFGPALGGGTAPTSAEIDAANAQVLGLIGSITGVDMSGLDLNEIPLTDATAPSTTLSDSSYAMTAFAAAILGSIDGTNTTIAAVIAAIVDDITIDDNGNVVISGDDLADIADQMVVALATLSAAGIPAASTALSNAQQTVTQGRTLGAGTITLAPAQKVPGTDDLAKTRTFVGVLIKVINGVSEITGAGGTGVDGGSATETFADALKAADDLSSAEVTQAYQQLEAALVSAEAELAAGATGSLADFTEANVTGDVEKSADGISLTVSDALSTWTNASTAVTAVLSIGAGERTDEGATGTFRATGVSLLVKSTVTPEGGDPVETVVQQFNGDTDATFLDEGEGLDLGLKTLDFTGSIVTSAMEGAPTLTADISLSGLEGTSVQLPDNGDGTTNNPEVTGDYTASFTFSSATTQTLTASFSGRIGEDAQNYALSVTDGSILGTSTIMGSVTRVVIPAAQLPETFVDTSVLTDGIAELTLEITTVEGSAGQLTGPSFVGAEDATGATTEGAPAGSIVIPVVDTEPAITATVDADGVVRYSDGSVQSLPAAIN